MWLKNYVICWRDISWKGGVIWQRTEGGGLKAEGGGRKAVGSGQSAERIRLTTRDPGYCLIIESDNRTSS